MMDGEVHYVISLNNNANENEKDAEQEKHRSNRWPNNYSQPIQTADT